MIKPRLYIQTSFILPSVAPEGGTILENRIDDNTVEYTWDRKIKVDASTNISVELIQNEILKEEFESDYTFGESIIECIWASSNDEVITVAKDGLNGCKVIAVGKGSTAVTVTVRTQQGNEYFTSIYITVTE